MQTSNISKGKFGEDTTVEYLLLHNYEILERNYRNRYGEVDIIAKQDEYICFVEVKTRTSEEFGRPSEAVNFRKQQKIKNLAISYLSNFPDCSARLDVAEVLVRKTRIGYEIYEFNYIENAYI